MSDQTIRIKYVGTVQRWPELSITGRQSAWMPGQIESRSPSEASALLATGLFSSPPVPVTAVTSPGGEIASLTAGGNPLWLQGVPLLDRVPLPTMHSIADPANLNIAAAILPAGVTLEFVDAPTEKYGRALKISIPSAITNQFICIPLFPDFQGRFPRARATVEWRVKTADWAKTPQFIPYIAERIGSNTAARVGHGTGLNSTSFSRFGVQGPFASAWNDVYRTFVCDSWTKTTANGDTTAQPWDAQNPYETKAVIFQVTTNAATEIFVNRAASPEWACAGIVTQFDGTYPLAFPMMDKMVSRGWFGVGSISGSNSSVTNYAERTPAAVKKYIAAGWDIIQHFMNMTTTVPADAVPLDGTMTESDVRRVLATWERFMVADGLLTARGRRAVSHLQNNNPENVSTLQQIFEEHGVFTSRGFGPDAKFGIQPTHSTTGVMPPSSIPSFWNGRWGRKNRRFCAASDSATVEGRHVYQGSRLEETMNNALNAKEMSWFYFHQLQEYAPPTYPESSQSSIQFAESWLAHMDAAVAADRAVMISITQADLLTYDRPGDVYLRWDGAWVSRSSSAVEDDRRVVL